jgi:hypothetical protein
MAIKPAGLPADGLRPGAPLQPGTQEWLKPWQFCLLLAVLIALRFPQVLAGFESFYLSDYSTFGYPLAFHHREAFWRGEIPLWNPLNNCGMPFLAQWNTLTLYPLSLIYLLLPMPWSLGAFGLAHLFLAGLGMYFLAFRWTGHRLAAAVAGTVYSFNGLTWFALMWPNNIAALGWMPWVVLAVRRAWCADTTRLIPWAALASAMQLLAGAPEVCLLTWLFIGVLCVRDLVRREVPLSRLRSRGLPIGLLAAGLAAAQLLPFFDLLAHSQRNTGFGDAGTMALSGWGLMNFLVPLLHSVRSPAGIYWQGGQAWTASYYVGASVIALTLLAVWRTRGQRAGLLAGVAIFSLWMALGSHGFLYPLLLKILPPIGFMRFPVKFVVLAVFVLPLLAACGVAWIQSQPEKGIPLDRKQLATAGIIVLIGIAAATAAGACAPLPGENTLVTLKSAALRILFLVLIAVCLGLLLREKDLVLRRAWQTGFVLLLWLDIFTHSPNLSPSLPSALLAPDVVRQYFNWDHEVEQGTSRALQDKTSFWTMLSRTSPDPMLDLNARRLSQFFNLNLLDHVAKFDGFYSLDLREYNEVFRRIYFGTNQASGLKDFLGISHITNPTNAVEWLPRGSALPLITTGQVPAFVPPGFTLDAVLADSFDPGRVVYLSEGDRPFLSVTNAGDARVLSLGFSASRLEIDVQAMTPSMLVVAQAFYHPWHAYIGRQPLRIFRANHAFQAMEVPAGRYRVTMIYEDDWFKRGTVISLLAWVGVTAWLWRIYRPRRQPA